MRFILGSGSPRRRIILENILDIEIIVPDADESQVWGESPEQYIYRVLDNKMRSIISSAGPGDECVIVTSDTIVTIDSLILGKPSSFDEAAEMLSLLSGREHRVLTGLAMSVHEAGTCREYKSIEATSVKFRPLDSAAARRYLELTPYMDKAGSYAIQENGDMIVESVSGSMTNVIGFPLRLFFSMLVSSGTARKVLGI